MKLKHILCSAIFTLALGLGSLIGLKRYEAVESKASGTDFSVTFQANVKTFEGWGGCSNYSFYPMTSNGSGGYTAISGYAWATVKNNATVTSSVASATLGFSSTESVDAVIFYFEQSGTTKQTVDMALVDSATSTKTIVFDVEPTSWNGNTFGCIGDTSTPIISLVGTFGGHSWDYDVDFSVNGSTNTATLNSYSLSKGEAIKVRRNHSWNQDWGWSAANGHITITDPQSRGEDCFGDGGGNNIAVLHDGTYNFSLNYSTGVLTITGTRANNDSDVIFEIFISTNGSDYSSTEMSLKSGSTTEYTITRDFVAGEKFYLKFGSYYYHYSDFKENEGTIKGIQFIADGQDVKALYSGNYTVYFETATGSNFGGWLQYNSVSEAQVRENVIAYAQYFNSEVGGACADNGVDTVIADLQTAWSNVKTRFDNAPADSVRTAIKAATISDENTHVSTFVGKYARVYELRGSSLSSQGGDFLLKGITPNSNAQIFSVVNDANNVTLIIVIVFSISLIALGGFFFIRKRKEDR